MPNPTPKGPAANHPPSVHPSNPYKFPEQLWHAGKLPPKHTDTHIFFFGYEGDDPHVCLQQWYPSPFKAPKSQPGPENEEVEFPTTEHYMMYHKAILMGDTEIANKILSETHPSAAKRLGREVRNFNAEKWKTVADRVVEEANYYKFTQDEDLKQVLLGTGDKELVEASPDDRIWGIGFNSEDAEGREDEWGNNGLGKALMRVRQRLRDG